MLALFLQPAKASGKIQVEAAIYITAMLIYAQKYDLPLLGEKKLI